MISASPRRYRAVSDACLSAILSRSPSKHELAAKLAGVRPDVDNVVGGPHRIFVVLDDNKRVADVAKVFEDLYQPRIVARMQADAWFVENIKRADEQGAEVRRKLNPLRLAAGKGRGETVEGQIFEPDLDKEFQPPSNLEQYLFGDLFSLIAQFKVLKKFVRVCDRHRDDLGQRAAADLYIAGLLPQPSAVAIRAGRVSAVFREKNANVQFVFFRLEPLEKALDAAPAFVAVDDAVLLKIGQVGERSVDVDIRRCDAYFSSSFCAQACCGRVKGSMAPSFIEISGFGNDKSVIDADRIAETLTRRAGTERRIETEKMRLGFFVTGAVVFADVRIRDT